MAIDADGCGELCLAAGADGAAAVSLNGAGLAGERRRSQELGRSSAEALEECQILHEPGDTAHEPVEVGAVTAHQGVGALHQGPGAVMPSSIAPPRVHRPSSGSDYLISGVIALSSGGFDSAAIHWVLPKWLPLHMPTKPFEPGRAAAHRTVS